MRRLSRNSAGFTILEILIVIALAGVVVSLTAPNFKKVIPEMRVMRAAQKLAADIKLAQQKAVSEMAIVNFHVDLSQNSYFAEVRERDAGGAWYQDGYDEFVEDPLNSGAYLLVDFDEESSRFKGAQLTGIEASYQSTHFAVATYGFYLSAIGDMYWPYADTIITITDPVSGYSRQVQVTYPMVKVTLLP